MGSLISKLSAALIFKSGSEQLSKVKPNMNNFFAYEAVDIDGVNVKMSEFSNKKAILVVNVACK